MNERLVEPEGAANSKGGKRKKPAHWLPAILQHPPSDWKLCVLQKYSCRADAEAEEERLIVAHRGNPYLLNRSEQADGSGRTPETRRRHLERLAILTAILQLSEEMVGYKVSEEEARAIRDDLASYKKWSSERAAAVERWASRLGLNRVTIYSYANAK